MAKIAQQYFTDVASLVELNDIANPDLIFAGQVLKITEPETAQSQPPQSPSSQETNQPTSIDNSKTDVRDTDSQANDSIIWVDHIIAPGEWLSTIAWKYGLTIDRLVQHNQISNPNLIFAGQVISVPTAAPASVTEPTPSPPSANEPPASTSEPASEPAARASEPAAPASEPPASAQPTIESRLEHWGTYYDIPLELFKALTWWESGWNNSLISVAGAVGIGQLMPATVDFVSNVLIGMRLDPHNPDDNIRMSARFLRYLLDETGNDRRYALGAYYQGLYSVRTNGIYLSSMQYVTGIMSLQARFK